MSDLVGEAYVRVHADTKYMANAIERDLKKAGKKGADSLLEDFDKTLRRTADTKLKRAQQDLADAIVGGDFDSMLKRSGLSVEQFVDGIEKDLRRFDRSNRVGFKGLEDALASLDKWAAGAKLKRATDEAAQSFESAWQEAAKVNRELDKQVRLGEQMARTWDRADTSQWRREMQSLTKVFKDAETEIDRAHAAALRMDADMSKTVRTGKGGLVLAERGIYRFRETTSKLNSDLDRFSVSGGLGRIFGKGSRNDFLNFLGSAVSGIVGIGESLLKLPFKAVDTFATGLEKVVLRFDELGGGAKAIGPLLQEGLAGFLKAGVPGLIAAAVALGSLSVILPGIVSLISAALGGITAIASALYFAIAGSLLPLVPVLVAVAAGLGPIIAGVVGVTTAIKDNEKSVKGIKDAWADFRKETEGFLPDFIEVIDRMATKLLGRLAPAFNQMGDAVLNVLDYLTQVFDAPGMKPFIDAWTNTMPGIFESVGRGVVDLLGALTKFFKPILPYADRLATAFADLMKRFSDWAGSAKGQNSIADFMDRAFEAADKLWTALGNIVTALHNTFDVGEDIAGGSFLDWLVDITQKWEDWTGSTDGKSELADWFDHAKEAGEKLFKIIGDVFDFFQRLDTDQAAEDLQGFLTLLGDITEAAKGAADFLNKASDAVHALSTLMGGGVPDTWTDSLVTIGVNVQSWREGVQRDMADIAIRIGEWWSGIPAALRTPWQTGIATVGGLLLALPGQTRAWLAGIPGVAASALAALVTTLPAPFQRGIGNVLTAITSFPGLVRGGLAGIPGIVGSALAGIITTLPAPFQRGIGTALGIIRGGPAAILGALGGWLAAAVNGVAGIYTALTEPFRNALSFVQGILGQIRGVAAAVSTTANPLGGLAALIPHARGGLVNGPTAILAGEAGREAIVPLDRPLSMVDPSVRDLAAYAQGKGGRGGVSIAPGAISVVVPNTNPYLAAESVLDRLVSLLGA